MRWLEAIRERAKWIDAEADALIGAHGHGAYDQAGKNERDANSLSAALFWHAVKKVVASRNAGAEVLSPTRASPCLSCLVEQIAGTRESGVPPLPVACLGCARRRLGFASSDRAPGEEPSIQRARWPD